MTRSGSIPEPTRRKRPNKRRHTRITDLPEGMRQQAAKRLRAQYGVDEAKLQARANKFGATAIKVDGVLWDSKSEHDRWLELQLLERQGLIRELRPKVAYLFCDTTRDDEGTVRKEWLKIRSKGYPNGRKVKYIADYVYVDCRPGQQEHLVVEDRKGYQTQESKLKIALMEWHYGIRVVLTRAPE